MQKKLTAVERFNKAMVEGLARYYHHTLSENVKEGIAHAKANKRWRYVKHS